MTTYTWDANHRLATIKDGRNIVYLTNHYDGNGRVDHQTLADPNASYSLAYTTDGSGNVMQTDVTNPRGFTKRLVFNASHYVTSAIEALNQPEQRTTTTERQPGTNLVTAVVDGLNRRTEYTYDGAGHVAAVTRLANTAEPVRTTYTYEPTYFQLATITDPLLHSWTVGYDGTGRITGVTDPLTHHTTVAMNTAGQVTSLTDPLQHTWQFGYTGPDRTSTTNPLGFAWRSFTDAAGRTLSTTDPLGHMTRLVPDRLNRVTTVTDALNRQTLFQYDANSRLRSLVDALNHSTSYTYDSSDRMATRTDPLQSSATYTYDINDNVTQITDRKGQITGYAYDSLDRLKQITFNDLSTITYTYDAGNRVLQIADSSNGTVTRQCDLLDRLTQETTGQGVINYTYDADDRRTSMTVAGQSQVAYVYDDANRLTSITQGSSVVAFTYDEANRRHTVTLPNGIVATYSYDNANQLASLTYSLGQNVLGDLTYTYDGDGNRASVGGSWARTGLPPFSSATYDANRLTTWSGQVFSYDLNGNLTSDGLTSYSWDARNQLTGLSGGTTASFAYDAFGRRRSKTISGTTTNLLYDGMNFVQELAGGGTPTGNLLTGIRIDEAFARTDTSGTSTFLVDALGSTLELANSSGTLQTHYTFEPFGATSTSGVASTNTQAFTGRENDVTGLYFYRARFYSPGLQRFASEDPIGFSGRSVNLHEYIYDNPMKYTDPSGNQLFPPILFEDPVIIDPELLELGRTMAEPRNSLPLPNGGRLDLSGKPHFNPETGQPVPTPHVHDPLPPFDEPYSHMPRGLNPVPRPATPGDIWDAIRHLFPSIPPLGTRKPPRGFCGTFPMCWT